MKLHHYQMLQAFEQADTEKIVQIMFENFEINIPDLEVRLYEGQDDEEMVRIFTTEGVYSWTKESGFYRNTSFAVFGPVRCEIFIP